MIVLALDSTTPVGSLGLRLPDGTCVVRRSDATHGWSERLPGQLLDLLGAHALGPAEVDLFAVAAGPGSLTGLRVGIATIQGLAFATGRPVAAISALDALAEHASTHAAGTAMPAPLIGAWTNAMRGEVFCSLYEPRVPADETTDPWCAIDGPAVGPPRDAAARWARLSGERPLLVAGDIAGELGVPLRQTLGSRVTCLERPALAAFLLALAIRRAARGETGPPHAVQPLYVRRPDAELARDRARATTGAAKEAGGG